MRNYKSFIFLFSIMIISMAQACVPKPESSDPINPKSHTLWVDQSKTATEITFTKTPHFTRTNTYSIIEPTSVKSAANWISDEEKSASISISLEPLDASKASEVAVDHRSDVIPTATVIETITYSEPTKTERPPEATETEGPPEPTLFAGCTNGCLTHPAGCDIKGNISFTTGEKIYHVPGGEYYDATIINPDYGERWFCTEQEAIDNGWRKSKY